MFFLGTKKWYVYYLVAWLLKFIYLSSLPVPIVWISTQFTTNNRKYVTQNSLVVNWWETVTKTGTLSITRACYVIYWHLKHKQWLETPQELLLILIRNKKETCYKISHAKV